MTPDEDKPYVEAPGLPVRRKRGRPSREEAAARALLEGSMAEDGSASILPIRGQTADSLVVKPLTSDHIARVIYYYSSRIIDILCMWLPKEGQQLAASALSMLTQGRRKITPLGATISGREMAVRTLFHSFHDPEALSVVLRGLQLESHLPLYAAGEDQAQRDAPAPIRKHLGLLASDLTLFRSAVVDRYAPLIGKRAWAYSWARRSSGVSVDMEDTHQNFVMAAFRGVDKFVPNIGSLTTYIGHWLREAGNSRYIVNVGDSYSLSRSARRKAFKDTSETGHSLTNNRGVPLDDVLGTQQEPETSPRVGETLSVNNRNKIDTIFHMRGASLSAVMLALGAFSSDHGVSDSDEAQTDDDDDAAVDTEDEYDSPF